MAKESPLAWGFWAARSWQWQGQHCYATLLIDRAAGLTIATAGLAIEYYGVDDAGRCGRVVAIERASIVEQPMRFGGVRRLICCPGCGGRCRILYGARRLRCRRCAGLRYRCQMLQPQDRAYRQAEKVARRCDPRARWGQRFPKKPKWMRWPTYRRLETKHELLEAIGITSGVPWFRREAAEVRAGYAAWRAEQRRRSTWSDAMRAAGSGANLTSPKQG
jgi:hypothetical protein